MLEMCQAQDVEVVNSKREKVTDTFIANMAEYKKKSGRPGAGMVWRWQVGTFLLNPGVFLKVQALPCNLDAVKANPGHMQTAANQPEANTGVNGVSE